MLGDALKTSVSDDSIGLPPDKLGPQAVGILAVLAVSGAVAILTLSKQKLRHYLFESTQAASISLSTVASNIFSSEASSSSTPTSNSVDHRSTTIMGAHDSSDSRVEEVTSEETKSGTFIDNGTGRTGIPFTEPADSPSYHRSASEILTCAGEIAPVPTVQPYTPSPAEPARRTRHGSKKVQFAPDVVEPSGDGREYRGRIRTGRNISSSMSSAGKLKGLDSGDELWGCPMSSTAGAKAVIKGHGFQILAKPRLPANRMALYRGRLGYRSHMTLDY